MAESSPEPGPAPLRAIVTGAADGVGAQCARALVRNTAQVALADIDKVPLARLANAINAHAFACDVLSEHSVTQMIGQAFEAMAGADLLINAAGNGYVRALGMMKVSRAFAAAAAGNPATIVNLAAASGSVEQFGHAGSKQAFRRLSEGLGNALHGHGITIITIDHLDDEQAVGDFIAQLYRTARLPTISGTERSADG